MMSQQMEPEQSYDMRTFKYNKIENNHLITKLQNRGLSNQVVKSMETNAAMLQAQNEDYSSSLVVLDSARNQQMMYSSPQSIN